MSGAIRMDLRQLRRTLEAVQGLPPRVLETYARLWQLEIWLRQMVYVELKASFGDSWRQKVPTGESSKERDKALGYMPTREEGPLSYIAFGQLLKVIDDHWSLFSPFLLPKDIWKARLIEIEQIRHRVAHFRIGYRDDHQRVVQLLRDLDQGFWRFCTSYNDSRAIVPATSDPVTERFVDLEQFPFVEVTPGRWAKVGTADPSAVFNPRIEVAQRPWAKTVPDDRIAGAVGYLYDVTIRGCDNRVFDYQRYLEDTRALHDKVVHIVLDAFYADVRVTIPSLLGVDEIIAIIERLIECVPHALHRDRIEEAQPTRVEQIAAEWPEYVLGSLNPLSFLCSDEPCSFFSA